MRTHAVQTEKRILTQQQCISWLQYGARRASSPPHGHCTDDEALGLWRSGLVIRLLITLHRLRQLGWTGTELGCQPATGWNRPSRAHYKAT